MSATTTPTQTPQTNQPSALAAPPAEELSTLDSALPADILEAAGKLGEAASAEEGEKPAESPPAEAAPDKVAVAAETIRKAKRLAKARREADARAERERLKAEQFSQRADQERQLHERTRAEVDAFKKDPLGAIRTLGVTARQLAEKAIAEGTPEAKIAALEASLVERAAKMDAELAAIRKERENERLAANERGAREQFFGLIKPDTHPRLHGMDRDIVLSMAKTAFDKARQRGHSPSDKQVLDYVESLLGPRDGTAGQSKPQPNPGTTVAKPVAKPSPTSRTVTADLAGRRYTSPQNFDDLDLHAQKDALAKMLEDAERGS